MTDNKNPQDSTSTGLTIDTSTGLTMAQVAERLGAALREQERQIRAWAADVAVGVKAALPQWAEASKAIWAINSRMQRAARIERYCKRQTHVAYNRPYRAPSPDVQWRTERPKIVMRVKAPQNLNNSDA